GLFPERELGRLHARLHANEVLDVVVEPGVELDKKINSAFALARNRAQVFLEQRFAAEHDEVWREVALVHALVAKRKSLRVWLEEEIEGIEHRHLGNQ